MPDPADRDATRGDPTRDRVGGRARGLLVRGAAAGFVAAATLAVWFLIVDGMAGRPFHTPGFLWRVLFGGEALELAGAQVALYTVLHFGAFLALGVGVAWLADRFRVPLGILGGAVLGFLLFDLLFYGGVWLTGVDVVGYLGWAEVLVGNVLACVGLTGTLRLMDADRNVSWREVLAEHEVLREGVVAGLIGAVAVAAWFLLIDVVAGRVFFTPAALGSVVFSGATGPEGVTVGPLMVLGYTGFHLVAFLATGLIAAGIAAAAEDRQPYLLFGAVLLFVTFETFFIGLVAIAANWLLDVIPWWSIAVANLIAAAAMGTYLWKRHPQLVAALGQPDLETPDLSARPRPQGPGAGSAGRSAEPATPRAEGSSADGPGRP